MKKGRPTSYSPEIAAEILAEIATTKIGLERICKRRKTFPSPRTIYRWMVDHPDFRQSYTRAKEDQTQVIEDEMIEIADTPQVGEIITIKPEGREIKRADMIEHRKLRLETRKWLLGKLKPKKYGEATTIKGDPDNPLKIEHDGAELMAKILGPEKKAEEPK